jgi:DNA-binding transcriptional ArsR family regulator
MSALMTEPVAATILALAETGGATLTELAEASGRRISTIQRAIEALEKADVIVKPLRGGEIRISEWAPGQALRDLAEWRLGSDAVDEILRRVRERARSHPRAASVGALRTAAEAQADADRAEIRRLLAMSDREREAFFLTSIRNLRRMFESARGSR